MGVQSPSILKTKFPYYIRFQVSLLIQSLESGYLKGLKARQLGIAGLKLGAGRQRKTDTIDPSVGIVLQKRIGDLLEPGDCLAVVHAASEQAAQAAEAEVLNSLTTSSNPVEPEPAIREWVG